MLTERDGLGRVPWEVLTPALVTLLCPEGNPASGHLFGDTNQALAGAGPGQGQLLRGGPLPAPHLLSGGTCGFRSWPAGAPTLTAASVLSLSLSFRLQPGVPGVTA